MHAISKFLQFAMFTYIMPSQILFICGDFSHHELSMENRIKEPQDQETYMNVKGIGIVKI